MKEVKKIIIFIIIIEKKYIDLHTHKSIVRIRTYIEINK